MKNVQNKSTFVVIGTNRMHKYLSSVFQCIYEWVDIKPNVYYLAVDRASKKVGKVNINEIYLDSIKEIFERRNMKFDNVIMNPPYDGNLHLKIVNNILNFLSPNGKITNLSPIRWLQDPLAEYKNGSDWIKFENLRNHIENILDISANYIQGLFNSEQYENIGLYTISLNAKGIKSCIKNNIINSLLHKVNIPTYFHKFISIYDARSKEGESNYESPFVRISPLHGHVGKKDWVDIISPEKKIALEKPLNKSCLDTTMNFKSDKEAINFFNSLQTMFMKACNLNIKTNLRVPSYAIPYMGNIINPRTGLKGYESSWTDNDFYQFFNITEDEQKIIEETMKPYLD